jgi:hypothetical protein
VAPLVKAADETREIMAMRELPVPKKGLRLESR